MVNFEFLFCGCCQTIKQAVVVAWKAMFDVVRMLQTYSGGFPQTAAEENQQSFLLLGTATEEELVKRPTHLRFADYFAKIL